MAIINVQSSGVWTGVSADASQFSGLQTPRIAWGDVEESAKSAYVFRKYSAQVPLDGTRCRIGQFEHHNHVIPLVNLSNIFTVELTITVTFGPDDNDRRTLGPVKFTHNETPNNSANPEDRVDLEKVDFDKVVEFQDHWYDMRVQGFLQYGEIVPVFISPEGTVNIADLVVSFTPYTGPS